MRVLVLSPYSERIVDAIEKAGDMAEVSVEPTSGIPDTDFIVSYGYRHIIKEPVLSAFKDRIINLHISLLPWNRGADPNFWSWFDDTPKGVTIHQIDEGLDTGPILLQDTVRFLPEDTLSTSWERLRCSVEVLFRENWHSIRRQAITPRPQVSAGTYHRSSGKTPHWDRLPKGYDTPCYEVTGLRNGQH